MRNEYLCCCVGGFSFVWHALFPHGHYYPCWWKQREWSPDAQFSFFTLRTEFFFFFPAHHTHLLHLFKGNKQYSTAGNLEHLFHSLAVRCGFYFIIYFEINMSMFKKHSSNHLWLTCIISSIPGSSHASHYKLIFIPLEGDRDLSNDCCVSLKR